LNYNASDATESKVVMAGTGTPLRSRSGDPVVPAIHVLASDERRGCAGQARAWRGYKRAESAL